MYFVRLFVNELIKIENILPSNMFDESVLYCRCMVMIFHSIDGAVTI